MASKEPVKGISKAPTGIKGLDQITYGGLPRGRPTLVCGNAGSGKTILALETLLHGAVEYGEPGVFVAFEETKDDLIKNIASMGYDLEDLVQKKLIFIDYIYVDPRGYQETGQYNLDGLFIRIQNAVKSINAKRVVIDTIEVLFSGFSNESMLRSEIRRLFLWLKEHNLTTLVTGEQGAGSMLTRRGLEEYVADCVIALSHRVAEGLFTRRLQIVKYRGSYHETNEFPFLIGRHGISLLPITALHMPSISLKERMSTGIPQFDEVLSAKGYYKGSSILISGTAGSGKTIFAGFFAKSLCENGKKCLFFSFEESQEEIIRNFFSIGLDLQPYVDKGLLRFETTRPTQWGLEKHLGNFIEGVELFQPDGVVMDPISTLAHCGNEGQVYAVLIQMIDFLKNRGVTFLMNLLFSEAQKSDITFGILSAIDAWILLRNVELNGEMNRELMVIKSRGMAHSNQVREFIISSDGINLKEPYYGRSGAFTGAARIIQESQDLIEDAARHLKLQKLNDEIEFKKQRIQRQIEELQSEMQITENEIEEEKKFLDLQEKLQNQTKSSVEKIRSSKKK